MERTRKLKFADIFISKLEEIKENFLQKSKITFSENLENDKMLNRIISIRNIHFNDIEKMKFYKLIEERNESIKKYKICDIEMNDKFSKIKVLLYEVVDIFEKIKIV
ncbi:hypothetical protein OCK72_06935 [Fusobacterium simiae]|uniref:Uncharacterized protein n=1 Tax=Fusobacterium simiae TaxID=855 RepID=A0ABT4DM66_FUSSI|nr:hypothetical protein [Fusobacterium simiae]MCY7008389.1 hypothetical protein [Fusobacterium simiae]